MSIKALIVDDEERARIVLKSLITKYVPEIEEIETVGSAMDAFFMIRQVQPDLVFLDIQMPFMNGFDLLGKIDHINFDIIFTTAYNQYAIQAIRFSALDYLLKPIDLLELKNAVARHIVRREAGLLPGPQYSNLVQNLTAKDTEQYSLAVGGTGGMKFFPVGEIIRLEGERNYTNFYFTGGRNYLSSKTLKEYEEILIEKGFIRVHKSHLVNRAFVRSVSPEGLLTFSDESTVEVSRRRLQEVKRLFS